MINLNEIAFTDKDGFEFNDGGQGNERCLFLRKSDRAAAGRAGNLQ